MIEGVPIVINTEPEGTQTIFREENEKKHIVPSKMIFKGYKNEKDRIQVNFIFLYLVF
jgi:hypothetical protein